MKEFYKENGINIVHKPITDFDEEDLKNKLIVASGIVKDILENPSAKLYVHCTAGMTRSTSTVITYLCQNHGRN